MKTKTRIIIFRGLFILIQFFCTGLIVSAQQTYEFPYQNPALSVEDRVNDLVGRMTTEEKISQMMNAAPAIDRLGIPEYNWWNECLHGVARAGLATVFPQAIGGVQPGIRILFFRVAITISDEARAKHHEFIETAQGKYIRVLHSGHLMSIYSGILDGEGDRRLTGKIRSSPGKLQFSL